MPASDTIVALSTPPGRSGIGVIRLSGPQSLPLVRALMRDREFAPEPNHVALKKLYDPGTAELLDQALVTFFRAPHSFTGEDIVELSCHGSPVLLRQVLDLLLGLDASPAGPGEFTLRALGHGRLNLSQAEAVRDLIDARTNAAARQAARQLGGELSLRLQPLKDELLEIIVLLESSLEFVEEDLPQLAAQSLVDRLYKLRSDLDNLASTFRAGRLLKDGLKITLVGRPNVGKSSVFNALLLTDRAIVTDIPGTTRDSLSELISLDGVPVLVTDTAGIRESNDIIESMGVERTRRAIADADLLVVVLDNSDRLTPEDEEILAGFEDRLRVLVLNKSDLQSRLGGEGRNDARLRGAIAVSAKTGVGLDELKAAIIEPFSSSEANDAGLLITDARHFDLLRRASVEAGDSCRLLSQSASEELVLVGLHNGLRMLGEITGETTPDEILGQIFATFCIGK